MATADISVRVQHSHTIAQSTLARHTSSQHRHTAHGTAAHSTGKRHSAEWHKSQARLTRHSSTVTLLQGWRGSGAALGDAWNRQPGAQRTSRKTAGKGASYMFSVHKKTPSPARRQRIGTRQPMSESWRRGRDGETVAQTMAVVVAVAVAVGQPDHFQSYLFTLHMCQFNRPTCQLEGK